MPGLQRFLHVSTAMICGRDAPASVQEAAYPDPRARHLVAYSASKAEAETALARAFPDLPIVVARPSIVVGHAELGAGPSSSILWMLRAADRLRMLPYDPGSCVDIVPADWVADALVHLLGKPHLAHGLYHVSTGETGRTPWSDVIAAFEAAEPSDGVRRFDRFDPESAAGRTALRARFARVFGLDGALKQAMLRATRAYYGFCALDLTFSNARLLAEGVPPPPRLPDYLATCLANSGCVVEQFADDLEMFTAPAPEAAPVANDALPLVATA